LIYLIRIKEKLSGRILLQHEKGMVRKMNTSDKNQKKREKPVKPGDNVFEEVVQAEAAGLYPSNELDGGMIPRSKAESRAGIDAEGESHTKK